jgi:hypothetical protein
MALRWPDKDPQAIKDYALDWTAALQDGETIDVSTWTPSGSGLVAFDDSIDEGICIVWLSGGTEGTTYGVVNRITTSRGMVDERTVNIKIKNQ